MNIKNRKRNILWNIPLYLIFWGLIVLAGFLLLESGSGTGGGAGSGLGGSGGGDGMGSGPSGTESGKGGKADKGQGALKKAVSKKDGFAAKKTDGKSEKSPAVKKPPRPQKMQKIPKQDSEGAIQVADDNEADASAVIHLQSNVPVGKGGKAGTGKGFFGVEVGGDDRTIFLLDISGSMSSSTQDGATTRLGLVKREMEICLKSGYKDARNKGGNGIFRIVTFSHQCNFFPADKNRCRFRKIDEVTSAIAFVHSMRSGGGTNMKHAWGTVLPIIREQQIRTVYFLTDGEPTDCSPDELIKFLKEQLPALKIHTFALGLSSDLLRNIAKNHGGIYREIF